MASATVDRGGPAALGPTQWTRRFVRRGAGPQFRRDIQGLRAVAVLLVLLSHANLRFAGGRVGIDVFFVISGFLLTGSLTTELKTRGRLSVLGFYARRAKRLLPTVAAVMVVTALLAFALQPRATWTSTAWDIIASSLYVQNWRVASIAAGHPAQATDPLLHFWSIAVAEQFYLLWPLWLLMVTWVPRRMLRPRRRRGSPPYAGWLLVGMVVIAAPSLTASVAYTKTNAAAAYLVTYTRLWELVLGGVLAIAAHWLLRTPPLLAAVLAWLGLAVVIGSAYAIDDATSLPGVWALAPTLGTTAAVGLGVAAGRLGPVSLLGFKPLVWVGGISYPLYLWHWPFMVAARAVLGHPVSAIQGLAVVLFSALVAWGSQRLLENPIRYRRVYSQRPWRALYLGATATLVGVFSGIVLLVGAYPPTPPPTRLSVTGAPAAPGAKVLGPHPKDSPRGRPVDSVRSIVPSPELALEDESGTDCVSRSFVTTTHPCVYGETTSKTTVALVGDGHSAQWLPPLEAVANKRGWRLVMYAMQNCSWVEGVTTSFAGRPYDNCVKWGADVAEHLAAHPPQILVVSNVARPAYGSQDGSAQAIVDGYLARWRPVAAAGAKIVVMEDTPRPGFDEHECVAADKGHLTRCAFDRSSHLPDRGALAIAARSPTVARDIDLTYAICPTRRCAPVIGGVLVYRDGDTLTATYAATLAPRVDRLLPKF